jgi:hypothetical protein
MISRKKAQKAQKGFRIERSGDDLVLTFVPFVLFCG